MRRLNNMTDQEADFPSIPTREFVTHDFTALNKHVEEVYHREHAITRSKYAHIFARYAMWSAIIIVAIGIAVFLMLWGYSLLSSPRIIETEVIVEKQVPFQPNIYVTIAQPRTLDTVEQTNIAAQERIGDLQSSQTSETEKSSPVAVFDYVIFKTIPFEEIGLKEINVGIRYANSTDKTPTKQWCYVERPNPNGTMLTVFIADKEGDLLVTRDISKSAAREFGVSLELLERAQGMCAFE